MTKFVDEPPTDAYVVITAASRSAFATQSAAVISASRMLEVAQWAEIEHTAPDGYVRRLRMEWQ